MEESLIGLYAQRGGFSFISIWYLFTALIFIYMLFVLGTAINEYGVGRIRELPLAMTVIRIAVIMIIASFVVEWISPDIVP